MAKRKRTRGPPLLWLYGSWINNCICNQWLSPLTLWVGVPVQRGVLDTTLCDEVYRWLHSGGILPVLRFPSPIKLSHDIAEILLKVALNTLTILSDVSLNDNLLFIQKQIGMNYNTTKLYSIIPYSKLNYLCNSCLENQIRIRIQSMLM